LLSQNSRPLRHPLKQALSGNLPNILLSGLFRSATEPDNKTFDRQFGTDNRRCRGHYQCQTAALAQYASSFCLKNHFENDNSAYYSSYNYCHLSCYLKFWVGSNRAYQISGFFMLSKCFLQLLA
jgi:hypothetical protein